MEEFQRIVLQSLSDLGERLSACERMTTENNKILKSLTTKKKVGKMSCPSWLPFKTVQDLISFESVDDDTYNQAVDYLAYLGGHNVEDAAALYLKNSFAVTEALLKNISWLGQRSKNITSLSESRFILACEEAVSLHNKLKKPNSTEFSDAMIKALKALKENLRRQIVAKAAGKQPPQRSRSRSQSPNESKDGSKSGTSKRRKVLELKKKQPSRQSRSRSQSTNESEDGSISGTSKRRKVMELNKKQSSRQSRSRSRSQDTENKDCFEKSTPNRRNGIKPRQNEFLSRNSTLILPNNNDVITTIADIHHVDTNEDLPPNIGNIDNGGDNDEFENDAQYMEKENEVNAVENDAVENDITSDDESKKEEESDDLEDEMEMECLVDDPDLQSYLRSQAALKKNCFKNNI